MNKKMCKDCHEIITKENSINGHNRIQLSLCRPCRNTRSKVAGRKKAATLKANPLW